MSAEKKSDSDKRQEHVYLIDGSGFIFRAYYALRIGPRSDGTPINAVLGFCNMLYKLLEDSRDGDKPSHVAVIFDTARKTFRNDLYEDYKANRAEPPEDLIPQFSMIRDAVKAFNVPSIELQGYEADDLIATYAREARERGVKVTIVSTDKDLMQLVGGDVDMLDTMKNRRIGPDEVVEKFGVGPEKVVDVQSLAGDSTDNVPGIPGIGIKTAAELINEYGDLDTLLDRAEEIKQPKRRQNLIEKADMARLSRELVRLKNDVPLPMPLDDLTVRHFDPDLLMPFLDEMEFKQLKERVAARHNIDPQGHVSHTTEEAGEAPERAYECVQTPEALDVWIEKARAAGTVAVDTETNSLNVMRCRLVGVSLSVEPGSACYIPLGHGSSTGEGSLDFDGGRPDQLPLETALEKLKDLLEDPAVLKVGQNLKFDMLVFLKHGIRVHPIDDTMLMSYVLESGLHGHGMDELSELHLGIRPIKFAEVTGTGRNKITFDQVPLDKATEYAAEDADVTLKLYGVLRPQVLERRMVRVYETLERRMPAVLADMEFAGIKVDPDILRRLSNDFAEEIASLEKQIHKLAGHPFNVGSPKQLGEVLFDEMSLDGGKKTKTGAYGTGADVLEGLAAQGHDLPARVLDWRQLSKLKSTYTDTLVNEINEGTGRIHTSYSLAATSTGRLSSNDPNLQNIPIRSTEGRKIRTAFVAEKGHKLVSADYSQIELRLLAEVAEIGALRKALSEGIDIHAMTASEVFGVPVEGMPSEVRRRAKAINFGIIYGISAFGLANQLGIPRGEAADYIKAYFEKFPGIRAYMDSTIEFCRKHGFVETIFGRRCHIRGINEKNPSMRSFSERAAINAPLQGSAADIMRRAMIQMPDILRRNRLKARMLLQVHDELIFEVPEDEVEETRKVVKSAMEKAAEPAITLSVPLTVECGSGDNWGEAH
ncbi:MAG TPA: DNA polymerase I [Alphaproteobacteria bacterium]|nr:DNA polymerase I [Alphaproteobacteria bacterium]